jgi:hypothetical protein
MSVDPLNYADAPTEGIRRVLEMATGQLHLRGEILKTNKIDYIRLSTTVATNALLERKGARHAFLVTKGFKVNGCHGIVLELLTHRPHKTMTGPAAHLTPVTAFDLCAQRSKTLRPLLFSLGDR